MRVVAHSVELQDPVAVAQLVHLVAGYRFEHQLGRMLREVVRHEGVLAPGQIVEE